jgi:hypothetical protein
MAANPLLPRDLISLFLDDRLDIYYKISKLFSHDR